MKLTLNIDPVPLARPRVTKFGTYLPKRSQTFRDAFQVMARAAFRQDPFTTPLAVTLHFFKNRNPAAKNYGDIDNLVKAVLDAGNGIIWQDDSIIAELHAFKAKGNNKIILEVDNYVD